MQQGFHSTERFQNKTARSSAYNPLILLRCMIIPVLLACRILIINRTREQITMSQRFPIGIFLFTVFLACAMAPSRTSGEELGMEESWGQQVIKLRAEDSERGQLFNEGNYAMFIHWGLYSH